MATTIPVTFHVTPGVPSRSLAGPPLAASIVNGASITTGPIAPGEILTILGLNLGPNTPVHSGVDENGRVPTTLAGLRVLFDGIPAPLLYASDTQVNTVVPYEAAGRTSVAITVEFNGLRFGSGLPLAAAAPGLFSADSTGRGQANAANQDGSANNAANPVARGSGIRFLATGLGQTSPGGITGELFQDQPARPVLPVSVTIGGVAATVQDVRPVAGQVAGLFQVTAITPQEVKPGPSVPVVLALGSSGSPDGVTIAVR